MSSLRDHCIDGRGTPSAIHRISTVCPTVTSWEPGSIRTVGGMNSEPGKSSHVFIGARWKLAYLIFTTRAFFLRVTLSSASSVAVP